MKKRSGAFITGGIVIVAMGLMVTAFMANASPYVTYDQAIKMQGQEGLHLSGDLVKDSVHMNFQNHTMEFTIVDANGSKVNVVHKGDPPANMGEATKIVAIGKITGEKFESEKLLIKCPSKYESEKDRKGA